MHIPSQKPKPDQLHHRSRFCLFGLNFETFLGDLRSWDQRLIRLWDKQYLRMTAPNAELKAIVPFPVAWIDSQLWTVGGITVHLEHPETDLVKSLYYQERLPRIQRFAWHHVMILGTVRNLCFSWRFQSPLLNVLRFLWFRFETAKF